MGNYHQKRLSDGRFPGVLLPWLCGLCWLLAGVGCASPLAQPSRQVDPTAEATPVGTPAPPLTQSPSATPFLPRPTATATLDPTPLPTLTPTPINAIPQRVRTQYTLTVSFDYDQHFLMVDQAIVFPNVTGEMLTDLVLVVDSNNQGSGFKLITLTWVDGEAIPDYTLERATLTIPLQEPLLPGEQVSFNLVFELQLPNQPAGLGYTLRETLLIDWYPYIPPYQPGQGWLVNKPWPFGEYLAYALGDYEVIIRLMNKNPNVVIAAGAPDLELGDTWHYRLDAARSFAWSASTAYQVLTRQADDITLSAYIFPEHQKAGEAALQTAAEALTFYGELFGPYPRQTYTIVEADFADGREYDGLIFLSRGYHAEYDGTQQNFLTLLAVHETAHQWWYGLVGNDQASEPWLDEALATYSELLYYERFHPELANWWWFYRINFFNPQGVVNLPLYEFGTFKPYWYAVYMRGALFLRDLRTEMGDEAFFMFLQEYARENVYKEAAAVDFFSLLEKSSPVDLSQVVGFYFDPRYLPDD
jgi:hypothetical protein